MSRVSSEVGEEKTRSRFQMQRRKQKRELVQQNKYWKTTERWNERREDVKRMTMEDAEENPHAL